MTNKNKTQRDNNDEVVQFGDKDTYDDMISNLKSAGINDVPANDNLTILRKYFFEKPINEIDIETPGYNVAEHNQHPSSKSLSGLEIIAELNIEKVKLHLQVDKDASLEPIKNIKNIVDLNIQKGTYSESDIQTLNSLDFSKINYQIGIDGDLHNFDGYNLSATKK